MKHHEKKLFDAALLAWTIGTTILLTLPGCPDRPANPGTENSLTIATSKPDYLDPAMGYKTSSWEPMWVAYTPLLTYRHAEGEAGTELIPGLAEALPKISDDGRTYTLTLRKGLRYSNGQPVKAGDFEHTIKRLFILHSPGASFFKEIVGAKKFRKAKDPEGNIAGIETDGATGRITIRLEKPVGTFPYVLAMVFGGLVPGDTPFEILTANPPPGVGPYRFVRSDPGREFVLERNPYFDIADIPKAQIERITAKVMDSRQQQVMGVMRDTFDFMHDEPPADFLGKVKEQHGDRFKEHTVESIYYLFMRVDLAPFDKIDVRKAVYHAIDRAAVAKFYGGQLDPTCNFLPPGIAGHSKLKCPYSGPDEDKARALIDKAGATGVEVKVWGRSDGPEREVAEYVSLVLNRIGLKATPEFVISSAYHSTIGMQKTKAQIGINTWFMDFPSPTNFFFLVDGATIQPISNENPGNVNDSVINGEIEALKHEVFPSEKSKARWAALDRRLSEQAYLIPLGHKIYSTFMSSRMDFDAALLHPVYQHDYTSWRLRDAKTGE